MNLLRRFLVTIYHFMCIDRVIAFLCIGPFKREIYDAFKIFLNDKEYLYKKSIKKYKKDICMSYLKYLVSPKEYFYFGFDKNKDHEYRKTFLSDQLEIRTLIKIEGYERFDELFEKYQFYKKAYPYFYRDVMLVKNVNDYNEFYRFTLKHNKIFVKPNAGSRGKGCAIFDVNNINKARKVFNYIISQSGEWIVEEVIVQGVETAIWNSSSVNTVRLLSFLSKDKYSILTPFFRMGRKGAIVDNCGSLGIFANIDTATGVITTDGYDESGEYFKKHPDSNIIIKGWQIPLYDDLCKLVEKIHRECFPNHIYIGFDFALTDKGWILIEGNWGQLVNQYVDKIGRKKEFFSLINYVNN